MAATSNASLSSLLSRSSLDDHEQLLAASEAALKSNKTDTQAQRVKIVALLKLDRFQDAVSFLEAADSTLRQQAALEYAYALYKAGRLEEAVNAASRSAGERGGQHVEAQARYRLEDYTRTAEIYSALQKSREAGEDFDLRVNQGAIDAQGQWLGFVDAASARRPDRDDLAAFETAYNAACGSIARGELSQAEVLLKRAKTLCQHSEELTEEQKLEELLPIMVQQTYVLFRQGKTAEAEAVAHEIKIEDIHDLSTRKVASSNSLLDSQLASNPFLAHKAFYSTPRIPENDKLFSYQSIPLSSNEKTVSLNSYKFEGLAKSTKHKVSTSSLTPTSSEALLLSAFHAASLARNEVGKAAISKVLPEYERRPLDLGLAITLVQMYVLAGNTTSAIELIESLAKRLEESSTEQEQELRYHPGLVSVLTALYKLQGRKEHIRRELAKAASYWKGRSRPPITLLRAAGISLLASSTPADAQSASDIFDKLYEEQPTDKATIAGFVASHAFAPEGVRNMSEKLKPVSELIADVDVNALESAGIPQASNALAIAQAGTSRKRALPSGAEVGGMTRVRRRRLPKGYDPSGNAKVDPERWLPMRDRSYYRPPKGKKKAKKGDDRTQGGAVSEDLDVSKQPQKGAEIVSGGGGGGGAKKKKGKSKK